MRIYMKYLGGYIGVEPGMPRVYHDRPVGAGWEELDAQPSKARTETDGAGNALWWTVTFVAAGKVLSQQPDGSLETRPSGTDAGYEQFLLTQQPDGKCLGLRYHQGQVLPVLIVEVKK